jgi:hypothetical protein
MSLTGLDVIVGVGLGELGGTIVTSNTIPEPGTVGLGVGLGVTGIAVTFMSTKSQGTLGVGEGYGT